MAKINICDLCKQPAETNHRLSLFLRDGKKKTEKKEAELCKKCYDLFLTRIESSTPMELAIVASFAEKLSAPITPAPGYISQPNTLTPEEVGNGAFKVPSSMTYAVARKMNKETAKTEAEKGECKHEEKSMEDGGVVCRKCHQSVES